MASRPHPPSAQRVLEARASGHVPRPGLVWLVGPLALLALGAVVGPHLGQRLRVLWGAWLLAPERVSEGLAELRSLLMISLAAILALVVGVAWLVQGPAFAGWGRRARIEPLTVDRTASALWAVGLLVLTAFTLDDFESWGWGFAALSLACLVIDVAFARAHWFASLWLTRREYVDELREQGPAPEVRARMRQR